MGMLGTVLLKALTSLAMALVSEEVVKDVVLFAMRKLVKSTKNTWDDELLEIAEKKWDPKSN